MKKRHLITAFLFFLTVPVLFAQVSGKEQQELLARFSAWKQEQITQHKYWATDSCNMQWAGEHESDEVSYGFPDDEYLFFSYGDLNTDGKSDLLVTFNPVQCDGGNGSMWMQESVLFISEGSGYKTISHDILPHRITSEQGFYQYKTISGKEITAMHYVFGEGDAYCCPSQQEPVTFDYATGRIIHTGANRFVDPNGEPEYYLGSVVGDSASIVQRNYPWVPAPETIFLSKNRMEIRLIAVSAFGKGTTTVIAYNEKWKATQYVYDYNRDDQLPEITNITGTTDFRAFFDKLVENHIFSLSDDRTLETDVFLYRPQTDEMTGRGMSVYDGTTYTLEFKVGKQFRSYTYHQPDAFAGYIDECRYFANIVDLFDTLIPHE